jgi:hypothetical protein
MIAVVADRERNHVEVEVAGAGADGPRQQHAGRHRQKQTRKANGEIMLARHRGQPAATLTLPTRPVEACVTMPLQQTHAAQLLPLRLRRKKKAGGTRLKIPSSQPASDRGWYCNIAILQYCNFAMLRAVGRFFLLLLLLLPAAAINQKVNAQHDYERSTIFNNPRMATHHPGTGTWIRCKPQYLQVAASCSKYTCTSIGSAWICMDLAGPTVQPDDSKASTTNLVRRLVSGCTSAAGAV